jgi:hypothetical protein
MIPEVRLQVHLLLHTDPNDLGSPVYCTDIRVRDTGGDVAYDGVILCQLVH